jgi:ATP-dependent DNA ligase
MLDTRTSSKRHLTPNGCEALRLVCETDLEGIVVKRKDGTYGQDWYKIRNPHYSQYEGRRELFERRVGRAAV